jgi:hypothetical protein
MRKFPFENWNFNSSGSVFCFWQFRNPKMKRLKRRNCNSLLIFIYGMKLSKDKKFAALFVALYVWRTPSINRIA